MTRRPLNCSRRMFVFSLPLSVALLIAPGCGLRIEKHQPESETSVTPQGGDSPQAAFKAFRNAAEQEQFLEMTSYVTDQTAQLLAGHMLLRGAMATATGAPSHPIARVLEKHEAGDFAMENFQQQSMIEIPDPAGIYNLAAEIVNKRRFVVDMLEAFKTLGLPLPITGFGKDVQHWQIHDDKAIGLIEHSDGRPEQIAFLRTDVGWQVHFAVRRASAAEGPANQDAPGDAFPAEVLDNTQDSTTPEPTGE